MLEHYNKYVDPLESSGQGYIWKKLLTKAEKKIPKNETSDKCIYKRDD